jgi:plasmid stabilization system protein ParE
MTYDVVISSRAQQEAQANHDWWAKHRSAQQAASWYDEFMKAALSLERDPDRWAVAAENDRFPYQIRQLNFGIGRKPTHRLVYTIRSNEVVVLRVRHLAQADIDVE